MEVPHDENFSIEEWRQLAPNFKTTTYALYALFFEDPSLLPAVNQLKSRDAFDQAMEHVIRAANAGEEFDVEVRPVFAKGANMFDRCRASTDQTFAILSVGPRLDEDEARHELLDELIKLARKKTA